MGGWVETAIKVRYQETDQMGVVYHSNYLIWFEVGRTEMIRQEVISYREMEEKGVLLPVVDVSCQYKQSAKYDDELLIRTKVSEYNGLRITFEYEVVRANDGKLLAIGTTKHVWIDKNYRPVRLDKKIPDIHHRINQLVNTNDELGISAKEEVNKGV